MDGPGLGEQGSGMYHLQRGEQREQSAILCMLKTKTKQEKKKNQGVF